MKRIWLVEFPTYKYNENVKLLAAKNLLKIIDAKFAKTINPDYVATETPKLTIKSQYKPKEPK